MISESPRLLTAVLAAIGAVVEGNVALSVVFGTVGASEVKPGDWIDEREPSASSAATVRVGVDVIAADRSVLLTGTVTVVTN
jgi:hypothetical protein